MAGRNVFARIGVQMDADQARRELESINQGVTKLGNARLDTARTQFEQLGASVGKTAAAYQPLTEAQRRAYEQREDDVQQIGRLQRSYATLGGALAAVDVQVQHGHRTAQDAARIQSGLIEAYSKGSAAVQGHAAAYAVANDNAAASTGRFKGALGNLGLQLQDVTVQAQMGTSAFIILAQQGPQIASAFGPAGIAIGTVVAIASVAAGVFFGMGNSMSDAEKAAKSYDDTMGAVRSIIDEAAASGKRLREGQEQEALSVADLAAHYRTLSETMLQVERIRLTSEKNKATEGLAAQRKAVAELLGDLDGIDIAVSRVQEFRDGLNKTRLAAGADTLDPISANVRALSEALKEFKAAGPTDIEAIGRLSVALDATAKAGGPFADAARKAADALVDPARKSVELSTQLTRLEDGLTAVGAASMRIPVPGRKPGEAGASSFATGAKDARTFADVLADLSDKAADLERRKLGDAWSLVNRAMEEGLTPADRYAKRVNDVQEAMQLVQQHADSMGEGLKALSPEQIERINQALREQDPAWQEAKRGAEAFQKEIQATAKEMSRDITEALLDRESKWSDLGKTIGKRIALGLVEANIVLPFTTAVVGAVPGLFGIASPANQNVANPGGVAGAASTLGTASNALSAGQSLYNVATGTNTLGTMAGSFATSSMGTSLGLSTWTPAATSVASNGMLVGGAGQSIATPALTSSGSSFVGAAGAVGAAAPYGILGGIGGAYIGSRTNSHLAGGLSGAALGVGSMAAGTAAMGAMGMGAAASAAGVSGMAGATAALSAIPVYGWIAAAVLAAVTAIAGTQKKEYFGAATWSKFDPGAGTELGTDTASKHMDAGPVVDRKYAINSGMRTAMQASGLGFAGDGMWLGVDYDQDKQRWRTNLAGWDNGITVSSSQDPAKAIVDTLKWLANNATEDRDLRPADKLGDIPLLVGDKNVITALRNTKNTTIEEVGKDMEAARVWTDVQKTTAAGYNYFNDAVQQMLHSAQQAAKQMEESYVDLLNRVSDTGLEERGKAQEMLRQSMEASLGIDDTTTALRNLLTPTEQVRVQFTALQPTLTALGYTAEQQAGIFDKLAAKAKKSVSDTYDAQMRDVRGQGFLDELWGVRQWWNTNALPVLDSGRNPNDLYEAKAKSIIEGLSDSQIDDVVSYFKDLDPVMASLADSLRGTTKAAIEAQKAVQANADSLTAWLNGQKLGDASSLSPWEKMQEAQRQFDAAISSARKSGDISGATRAADTLLSASKPALVMGTEGYSQREAWITSTLKNLGHELGLPGFKTGGSFEVGGWGGVDSTLVRFMATPGERVTVTRPGQQAQSQTVVVRDNEDVVRALSQMVGVLSDKLDNVTAELSSLKAEKRKDTNLELMRKAS